MFRDKQLMSSDFTILPDEWSGRMEHTDDILCAVYRAPGEAKESKEGNNWQMFVNKLKSGWEIM